MNSPVWTPRVTVAAVIERDGKYLLVEETTDQGMVFNQPAGHLEDDESLSDAVKREVREETAWRFEPAGLVGVYRWRIPDTDSTYLRFCFYGGCSDHHHGQHLDEGILGTHWMSREELAGCGRLRSPLVLTCLDDYLAGRRHPLELITDLG